MQTPPRSRLSAGLMRSEREKKKMRALVVTVLAACIVAGCKGPVGPQGPQGPQGIPGEQGPTGPQGPAGESAEFYFQIAQVESDGNAVVIFEGLQVETTVINCYLSIDRATWLLIGTDLEGPTCGATNSGADLLVILIDAPPGWYFLATASA